MRPQAPPLKSQGIKTKLTPFIARHIVPRKVALVVGVDDGAVPGFDVLCGFGDDSPNIVEGLGGSSPSFQISQERWNHWTRCAVLRL